MTSASDGSSTDRTLLVPAAGELFHAELEIKKSRFITWIGRTDNEEEARDFIAAARQEFPDARHHCSAYIYEVEGANPVERSSDDGEPSGTAGRPMLDVLQGSGLTNITAVVIRYFGGIKLGTGGLVRAYSDAVSEGLKAVNTMRRRQLALRAVTVSAADAGRIEAELRGRGFNIVDTTWGADVEYVISLADADIDELAGFMATITRGEVEELIDKGTSWVERPL